MTKSRKLAALVAIAAVLLTFCTSANAQEEEDYEEQKGMYIEKPRTFFAGAVLGANFSQVDGDNFAGYYKAGINVGGIGYVRLRKHLAMSWEILYSQRGADSKFPRISGADSILILKYGVSTNYAEIPVMVNYFDKRRSHFGAGLSFSRLVSSSETIKTAPPHVVDFNPYPFSKNNLDLLAGVQLHIVKGLFLNVRFQYSLMPIRIKSHPDYSRSQKQFSNLWTVRLMYLLI